MSWADGSLLAPVVGLGLWALALYGLACLSFWIGLGVLRFLRSQSLAWVMENAGVDFGRAEPEPEPEPVREPDAADRALSLYVAYANRDRDGNGAGDLGGNGGGVRGW